MNKKAIFFTLSIFLLVTAVFSLSLVIFEHVNKSGLDRKTELASLDRLSELSLSIEKSMVKLADLTFIKDALIEENPDETTNVTLTEMLSSRDEEWDSETEQNMENFKTFVEEKDEHAIINIEAIQNKELPFVILPHNITYSRDWATGHVKLNAIPEQMNFNSYFILVNAGNAGIKNTNSHFGSSGNFSFGVKAMDDYGFNEINQELVNPSSSSDIKIFFKGGNTVTVSLTNSQLEIWTNTNESIEIATTIGGLIDMNESVSIDYSNNALMLDFDELGISKIRPLVLQ